MDHAQLREALEKAEELCSQVNEGVREKENSDRLEWIQNHVQCEGITEVSNNIQYLHLYFFLLRVFVHFCVDDAVQLKCTRVRLSAVIVTIFLILQSTLTCFQS